MAREFKQYIANMGIIVKNALLEASQSIGMIECNHELLQ